MKNTTSSNVQLGIFVMIGLAFLLVTLYLIGSNQNLFDQTFEVKATFYNVNGLMKGNNVRFSGIDVGTIKKVEIISDTTVKVTMVIKNSLHPFIKKSSIATVGTDGLMGNKLVNISNVAGGSSDIVEEGDMLTSIKPVETDEMLRTLDLTNQNLYLITTDLKRITQKLKSSNSLWSLLMDTSVAQNVKQSISNIRATTNNTAAFSRDLNVLIQDIKNGKGVAGVLLYDTVSTVKLQKSIQQLQQATTKAVELTSDIRVVTEQLKKGQGATGVLINDTAFAQDLKKSMKNIEFGTDRFNQNMEALKHNFFFRGYFKKQDKELKKMREDSIQKASKMRK
ncbi:MAG: MlaD family protein [Flammeovirgaceae bacterium]|jgi:phospholipid/cholesterol/gamma-HCH transport system substrate-binding protein|nr:MlaD family protein [Flammeovirgaceae bacterium]